MFSSLISSINSFDINWKAVIFGISAVQFTVQSYLKYRQYKSIGKTEYKISSSSSNSNIQQQPLKSPSESLEQDIQDVVYAKANLKLKFVSETFDLIQEAVFFKLNVYPTLWSTTGTLVPYIASVIPYFSGSITQSLLFASGLFLTRFVNSLISNYYNFFVIEENYGFNKYTFRDWFFEEVRTAIGTGVKKLSALALSLKLIELCKPHLSSYLLYLYITLSVFGLVIYPIVIVPYLYKSDKLEPGELDDLIREVARKTNFPLQNIYILNGAEKSNHSNAFFFGFPFCSENLFIYDTVIDNVKREELPAMLVHEIGHWKLNHTKKRHLLLIGNTGLLLKLFDFIINSKSLYIDFKFGGNQTPIIIGLSIFNYIYNSVEFFFNYLFNIVVRTGVFSADRYTISLGFGKELVSSLIAINNRSFDHLNHDIYYSIQENDQPDLQDRIDYINHHVFGGSRNKKST